MYQQQPLNHQPSLSPSNTHHYFIIKPPFSPQSSPPLPITSLQQQLHYSNQPSNSQPLSQIPKPNQNQNLMQPYQNLIKNKKKRGKGSLPVLGFPWSPASDVPSTKSSSGDGCCSVGDNIFRNQVRPARGRC
ncbi:hypothetical protein V6N11_063567 [Hibiscus sabdariffa]|uniref:Uncharacterized protein n=1 Tax=Hibiscus sabdariffa TaxID=183260 RepID=A0ABR2A8J2_9ROSI